MHLIPEKEVTGYIFCVIFKCCSFEVAVDPFMLFFQTERSRLQSEKDELAASKDAIVAEISMLQVSTI